MSVSKKEYDKMTKDASPSSPIVLNCIKAFVFGGAICLLGEVLFSLYRMTDMREDEVKALVPMTLIVITSILTAIGVFDKIARHAGAGTAPLRGSAAGLCGHHAGHPRLSGAVTKHGATGATQNRAAKRAGCKEKER